MRCAHLANGLRDVYQLRHSDVYDIGNYWREHVRRLWRANGIVKRVGIVESGRIKSPVVFWLPEASDTGARRYVYSLSVEQAEAILLHELAHVKRADYL